jgi:hypothetical protein
MHDDSLSWLQFNEVIMHDDSLSWLQFNEVISWVYQTLICRTCEMVGWTESESSCISALEVSILALSTIFIFDVGIVPTVWYCFCVFHFTLTRKNILVCLKFTSSNNENVDNGFSSTKLSCMTTHFHGFSSTKLSVECTRP